MVMQGAQGLKLSHTRYLGAGSEEERPRLELAPIWVAATVLLIVLVPYFILFHNRLEPNEQREMVSPIENNLGITSAGNFQRTWLP